MTGQVSIGVLGGTSWIANQAVIPAIHDSQRATLGSVGSRSGSVSYAEVLSDPAVEAVYIALPNDWAPRRSRADRRISARRPPAPG